MLSKNHTNFNGLKQHTFISHSYYVSITIWWQGLDMEFLMSVITQNPKVTA